MLESFLESSLLFGSSTWARTRDLRINSPALYQLSYRGLQPQIIASIFGFFEIGPVEIAFMRIQPLGAIRKNSLG